MTVNYRKRVERSENIKLKRQPNLSDAAFKSQDTPENAASERL